MKLIDLTRINQLIDGLLDKINDKYATKAELNSGLKGKAEVNHGMHLTLGNTQDSAYRGDYGNAAYQHSQTAHAPSNAQKNSDITKAEIEAKLTGNINTHTHDQYLTQHQDISGKADKTELHNHSNKTILDGITANKITKWDSASTFNGDYESLTNKPDLTKIDALHLNGYSLWIGTTEEFEAITERDANTLYFKIDDGATYKLKGKTIVRFGDSITEDGAIVDEIISAVTGANVINVGVACARMTSDDSSQGYDGFSMTNLVFAYYNQKQGNENPWSYQESQNEITKGNGDDNTEILNRLKSIDFSQVDYVLISYGTNDFAGNVPLGGLDDSWWDETGKTFCGAVNFSVSMLLTMYPHLKIVFTSPTWRGRLYEDELICDNAMNSENLMLKHYVKSLKLLCEKNHVQFIDLFNIGINEFNHAYYLWDRLHFNEAGKVLLGEYIANGLLNSSPMNEAEMITGDLNYLHTDDKTDLVAAINEVDVYAHNNIGAVENLQTTNKGNLVEAINELFISANNGKQLIANAIGDSGLTSNSTFSAMSNAITDKRDRLYNLMAEGGYEVSSDMSIGRLLEILESIGIGVSDIKQIACGGYHTVILKTDGSLYSCGNNGGGQLGIGTVTDNPTFTQVTTNISNDVKEVACGSTYTFILKNDGSIWACGEGGYGHLGLGSGGNKTTFTKVTTNVKQIACGSGHTFILKNDGSVWACGDNYYGQLGLGSTDNKYTFTRVTTNINNDVKQIACGDDFTFILKNDGSIWACGDGGDGQLGLGTNMYKTTFTKITTNINNDVKEIVCGDYHTVILKNDGSVWATGGNGEGQLGLGSTTGDNRSTFTKITTNVSNVKQIACGSIHTFILKNDGSLWACGDGSKGQLGLGISDKTTFTQVTTNISNDVKEIICGYEHTFILKNDGTVWSCGRNTNGQLGLGTIGSSNYGNFTNIPRGF